MDAYKTFDKYLTEENIQQPAVMLADGQSSRIDYRVLDFLIEKSIHLFIMTPGTTSVTQLSDQSVNQNLHHQAFTNCMHSYDRICNMHANSIMHTQKVVDDIKSSV